MFCYFTPNSRPPQCQLGENEYTTLRYIKAVAARIAKGFTYDPGHSDLDDEQPIVIRATLGDWRELNRHFQEWDEMGRDSATANTTLNTYDRTT